jgi:hypothetical protein
MLHALEHRKSRRNLLGWGLEGQVTESGSEDLLTSAIFSRLGYLCDSNRTRLFQHACHMNVESLGQLVKLEFWPQLTCEDRIVIPDLWMQFEHGHVLVEAKRWDGFSMQLKNQLACQLEGLRAEVGQGSRIWQLAIGGHDQLSGEDAISRAIADLRTSPAQELYVGEWRSFEQASNLISPESSAEQRILADLRLALKLHKVNFKKPEAMGKLVPANIRNDRMPACRRWRVP